MNTTIIALLAGLFGSILTTLIGKTFDYFQNKNDFNNELRKEYFNKKLNSLEKASIQYTLILSSFSTLYSFFKVISDERFYLSEDVYVPMLKNANDNLIKAQSTINDPGFAINIYIDNDIIDSKIQELEIKLFESIGLVGNFLFQLNFHFEVLAKGVFQNKEEDIRDHIKVIEHELIDAINTLITQIELYKNEIYKIQLIIRKELKKYELSK